MYGAHAKWALQENQRKEETVATLIISWHPPRAHTLPRSNTVGTEELAAFITTPDSESPWIEVS